MTSKDLNMAKNVTPAETFHVTKTDKEKAKEKLRELMQEESKLVKGIFQCFETPGSTVKITVKKYPGIDKGGVPHFDKTMTDGMIYEVPLYVARHLNGTDITAGAMGPPELRNSNIGSCSYPVHGFLWNKGAPAPQSAMGLASDGSRGGMVEMPVPIVGVSRRVKRFGFQSLEFAGQAA
jgi:hypothetical protein